MADGREPARPARRTAGATGDGADGRDAARATAWSAVAARAAGSLRWAALGLAAVVLLIFLVAQRQSVDVSYGTSPSGGARVDEGSAGELTYASVPSTAAMEAMVEREPVVRLPGSIARWDEAAVTAAIGDADLRILVAPPGLDEEERERVDDVENADVVVKGVSVTGGFYGVSADTNASWRAQFGSADVTDLMLGMIAALRDQDAPPDVDALTFREPTAAELDPVVADLRASGVHIAEGADLERVPERSSATAFPDGALFAVFPLANGPGPVVDHGSALAAAFPDTAIVVMRGWWIEYHGPDADEFADVVAGSFYGVFEDRISRFAYPQGNVLDAYLAQVTDVRYAGLFDRPLPYTPFDPLRVSLPALPWVFAACVAAFLVLSARELQRPKAVSAPVVGVVSRGTAPSRLAGLTALAIELSGLTAGAGDAALTRGIAKLGAARDAVHDDLGDRHAHTLLDDAERELDDAARSIGRADYRPDAYLRTRLA